MKRLPVLNAILTVTDYEELAAHCQELASRTKPSAIEFANTHIVTMIRHDGAFREMMGCYDHLIPDGMPLVWCLNRAGAKMRDRVYGPTFMKHVLESPHRGISHYLLGGSEACGVRLREIFKRYNPDLKIVGSFHGRCHPDGTLEGGAEQSVVDEINRLSPDFIWVGFGTPKQQAWTNRHKQLLRRGVILTVGFAFDANAGMKPDAPPWMQRCGLTWLYRLVTEPRRLGPRYLKFNSLFIYYLLRGGRAQPVKSQ